eukprot:m.1508620 g.1508620  ORF g.1508620 m.1508620 type:complete len:75 (+) comp25209_c0_seq158:6480-6704(+)
MCTTVSITQATLGGVLARCAIDLPVEGDAARASRGGGIKMKDTLDFGVSASSGREPNPMVRCCRTRSCAHLQTP